MWNYDDENVIYNTKLINLNKFTWKNHISRQWIYDFIVHKYKKITNIVL